jgi:hypothetical protein
MKDLVFIIFVLGLVFAPAIYAILFAIAKRIEEGGKKKHEQ